MADEQIELLKKIHDKLDFLAKCKVSQILDNELKDKQERAVYELTGRSNQTEIAKQTGISAGKISGLWQKWAAKGLLKKEGQVYCKIFD